MWCFKKKEGVNGDKRYWLLGLKNTGIKANKKKSLTNPSKLHKTHGTKAIKANNKGKMSVQQTDISLSKRIRGKEARIHTNVNTKMEDLIPKIKPEINPSKPGDNEKDELSLWLTISNPI